MGAWLAIVVLSATGVSGCAWMYSAPTPVRTQAYPAAPDAIAPTLLILLPGRGDEAEAFAEHGFVDDVRASGAAVDVIAVGATFGYYMKETIVDRVWDDVVVPAQQRGYKHIWLGGISMGGLGTFIVARRHEQAFERLIVLAPYLGPKDLLQQIKAAGGPARWTPTDPNDPYQRMWTWLKGYTAPGAKLPPITLGYGTSDHLAEAEHILEPLVAPDQIFQGSGGHEWTTWRPLWKRIWSAPAHP